MPPVINPTRAQATARHVKIMRRAGGGNRRRKVPRQAYPKLIEAEYAAGIMRLVARARAVVDAALPEIRALVAAAQRERRVDSARADGLRLDAGESERLKALMDMMRDRVEENTRPTEIEQLARLFAQRTSTFQRKQLGNQVRAALGADVFSSDKRIPSLVDHFIGENVSLISSIQPRLLDDVRDTAQRAITGGTLPDDLTEEIRGRYGVTESRARLIARDQIGKLNGNLNQYRQSELGIDSYIWRTSGDERVRAEHERLDGQEFRWDDPPDPGHPGEDYQCRCFAEPVLRAISQELEDL